MAAIISGHSGAICGKSVTEEGRAKRLEELTMPVFHTKTIQSILDPVAQQVGREGHNFTVVWDHVPPVLRVCRDSAVYCQTYVQVTCGFRRDLLIIHSSCSYTVIQAQTLPNKKATEFISVMDETKTNGSIDSFPWPRTITGTVRPSVVHVEVSRMCHT